MTKHKLAKAKARRKQHNKERNERQHSYRKSGVPPEAAAAAHPKPLDKDALLAMRKPVMAALPDGEYLGNKEEGPVEVPAMRERRPEPTEEDWADTMAARRAEGDRR